MTILKKAAIAVAATGGAVLLAGMLLPKSAHVERAIVIEAAPATVFTVLNGFRQFDKWSPWAGLDPQATTTYEGPELGVGAKMSWSGNAAVGSGSQEIVESTPHSAIKLRLGFGDFGGVFGATYRLQPVDGGTQVTWAFDGDYRGSLVGGWLALLSGRMVGPDYEKGLAKLKAFVESMPKGDFSALRFESVQVPATPLVMTSVRSRDEPRAIGLALGVAYGRLAGYLNVQGLAPAGPNLAIYRASDGGTLTIDAAIPVAQAPAPAGAVRVGELPAGAAVRAEYRGAHAGLAAAREQVMAYVAAAGLQPSGPLWEQYVGDPAQVSAAELVTNLYVPVR